jgi:5-methyltetrahydrofolate--homocysteine methyltransferase
MALTQGLDSGIIDPTSRSNMEAIRAFHVLNNIDLDAEEFLQYYNDMSKNGLDVDSQEKEALEENRSLRQIILKGLKSEAQAKARSLLEQKSPMEIVNSTIVPALDEVGHLYDQNIIFLPQLLRSAETVKIAFKEVKTAMTKDAASGMTEQKILLATVKGDVHDIGKNIVKILLENYDYTIIDLGRDVGLDEIIQNIKSEEIQLVGLSALMTTTVENMEKTISAIHQQCPQCQVMVGGAVLNSKYATMIKADFYGKDAQAAVKIAKEYFKTV